MDASAGLTTVRTQVALVFEGVDPLESRTFFWPEGAMDYVRRLYKAGVEIAVIGPKPQERVGTKKNVLRFLDRHRVVSLKQLSRAKSQALELKLLGRKLRNWTRVRADFVMVSGALGKWPEAYPGMYLPGHLTLDAWWRLVGVQKQIPAHRVCFLGGGHRGLTAASWLRDQGGVEVCYVEPGPHPQHWRSYRDRFLLKGGRYFGHHRLAKVAKNGKQGLDVFLQGPQGTQVIEVDAIVVGSKNTEFLSSPQMARQGLQYIQRRWGLHDPVVDPESKIFSQLDWDEAYWRTCHTLGIGDHGAYDGAIQRIKEARRDLLRYRKDGRGLEYSGKNLARSAFSLIRESGSSPIRFREDRPVASLECFEELGCRECVQACPERAIEKVNLAGFPKLNVDACTGCGLCVAVCPSGAAVMVKEDPKRQIAHYFLPDDSEELWRPQQPVQLCNRKGDFLAAGRVVDQKTFRGGVHRVLEITGPTYTLWDARGFRLRAGELEEAKGRDEFFAQKKVWITIQGARRLAPEGVLLTRLLWYYGYRRFEDALFCEDSSCRMCQLKVFDKPVLACQTRVTEGMVVEWTPPLGQEHSCFCSPTKDETLTPEALGREGCAPSLACEISGWGQGTCRGRWCASRCKPQDTGTKERPEFYGFRQNPWLELWLDDL